MTLIGFEMPPDQLGHTIRVAEQRAPILARQRKRHPEPVVVVVAAFMNTPIRILIGVAAFQEQFGGSLSTQGDIRARIKI